MDTRESSKGRSPPGFVPMSKNFQGDSSPPRRRARRVARAAQGVMAQEIARRRACAQIRAGGGTFP
jgi:hypothetical protein